MVRRFCFPAPLAPTSSRAVTDGELRDTKLVRGGLGRSAFEETSDALYMLSSYAYDSADETAALAAAAGRLLYSR